MTSRKRCVFLISSRQAEYLKRLAAAHGHTVSELLRRVIDLHMAENPVPKTRRRVEQQNA